MNSYELSRKWFNFCFENPEQVKPIHTSIYFFAIEHCNRLGWKEKFGFPSQMVMEALGIKNWRTYSKALNEIVLFGFIEVIEVSKNQYSSNIIAIVKNTKATTKALDKALSKHLQEQGTKQGQSTVSIDKQLNKETIKLINKNALLIDSNLRDWIDDFKNKKSNQPKGFEFFFGDNEFCEIWKDFIQVKKKKKASITNRALTSQLEKLEKWSKGSLETAKEILENSVNGGWSGIFEPKKNKQYETRSTEDRSTRIIALARGDHRNT